MERTTRIALITGGSRGLGKNMAVKIASKGLNVVITYNRNANEAAKVVSEIEALGQKALAVQLDTSNVQNFSTFFTDLSNQLPTVFGTDKIDFLINNAGIGIHASIAETTEDQFNQLMDIHFKGVFFLTQHALNHMNDGGGIINISSGLARFCAPGYAAYGAMKGAIEVLTRYQAKELGTRGIRSNVIAPGAIETDFGGGLVRDNAQYNEYVSAATALGRAGLPDDIGGVAAFLCTEDARWINAQRIEVSGGMNL